MLRDRWAGLALAAVTLLAAATGAVAAIRYPRAVAGASVAVLVADAVILAAYLAYAVRVALCGDPSERGVGLWFGIAAAACWSAEIWAGGPARLGHGTEQALGAAFALAATAVTVAAGIVAAVRSARPAHVWRSGLLAGATSGALVYAFAVTITMTMLPVLGGRGDYQAEFAASHLRTMNDFLVNDILGAVTAHLAINLVLGVLGAAVGRIVLARRSPSATARPARDTAP